MAAGLMSSGRVNGENQAIEDAQDQQSRERVDVTLLKDDVHIHQPVAQDGVGPGDGDQHQKQNRHFL